jgi:hypothetical protein
MRSSLQTGGAWGKVAALNTWYAVHMALLIHATIQVMGDRERLAAFRGQLDSALATDFPEVACTGSHRDDSLHYDLKTAGIPFPALVAASREFPDLDLRVRWVNPETGTRAAADIRAGRIEAQSADPLDKTSAGRQPGYAAVGMDGVLRLAFALFSVRCDGCIGYAITANRDALFEIRKSGNKATLLLAEDDAPQWSAGWEFDLAIGEKTPFDVSTTASIANIDYNKWRGYAEAFVADWLWLDTDSDETTAIERQRCADHSVAIHPANLRYEKLKTLRDTGPAPSGQYQVDHLGEGERYALYVLRVCFGEP